MKLSRILLLTLSLFSGFSFANTCNVTGNYVCVDGRKGEVNGFGVDKADAKRDARSKADRSCVYEGGINYIRFTKISSFC